MTTFTADPSAPPPVPVAGEPQSKGEILRELRALHERSTGFWERFSTADFYAPLGDAWSPADNVRHLLKSCRPVARALRVPKVLLIVPGRGLALRRSRGYRLMWTTYHAALAGGVKAGRFAPKPEAVADPEAGRRELMAKREATAAELHGAIEGWSEWALDRFRLPHPALGQLTVREMLFFTLDHNEHHVHNVARRLGWLPAAPADR